MSAVKRDARRGVRVLVAEAPGVAREPLAGLLRRDPGIEVVGAVSDGQAAVSFVRRHRPDVALIELELPSVDGFEATRRIMEEHPVPIVICTGRARAADQAIAFRTMEAGALSCIAKPHPGSDEFAAASAHLVQTVKLMAEVKVVRRWTSHRGRPLAPPPAAPANGEDIRVIGIGASTGGPPVLQALLGALPAHFPLPLLVVQHISQGFLGGLAQWLGETTGLRVTVASHGCLPLPGHVYLAPDDFHMGVRPCGQLYLSHEEPENGVRPSVSFLFRTLAAHCQSRAVGVLLTGMGKDGAAELGLMRERGAVTIAQDRQSSVIHGMPGEAIASGAAAHVLPPERIAELLIALASRRFAAGDQAQ